MKASVSTSAPVISLAGFLFSFPLIRFLLCFSSSSFAGVDSFFRRHWNALFPCPIVLSLFSALTSRLLLKLSRQTCLFNQPSNPQSCPQNLLNLSSVPFSFCPKKKQSFQSFLLLTGPSALSRLFSVFPISLTPQISLSRPLSPTSPVLLFPFSFAFCFCSRQSSLMKNLPPAADAFSSLLY